MRFLVVLSSVSWISRAWSDAAEGSSSALYAGDETEKIIGKQHWSEVSPKWWEAWPQPKSQASTIEASEVMQALEQVAAGNESARDYLLVDVRRADWEGGGAITSSINIPAHALYHARSTIYQLCIRAGMKRVIFFCRSSKGRGPRCAGWMKDYIDEVGGDVEALVMKGGAKGWAHAYGGKMMDYYDKDNWQRQDPE